MKRKSSSLHLSYKDREYFTENLAILMKSAVPIGEILDSLKATTRSKRYIKALDTMQADIDGGMSLSDAIDKAGVVSSQTGALISLGEQTGRLVENLELAAKQEEKRHIFIAKVRSAFIYPAFVIVLTIVIGLAIAWFLLPKLTNTFSQLDVKLPLISRVMLSFGDFLHAHGLIFVPAVLIGLLLLQYVLFFAPPTKRYGQAILLRLPGIGRLMVEVEVAQFGYLLQALLSAGISVTQAMKLLAEASTTYQYQRFYKHMATTLNDGYSFKSGMQEYPHVRRLLPIAVQQMVVAGERSGALDDVLGTVGRTYEAKSDVTTQNLEAVVEPLLLVFVAIGVLLVAIAVIIPIYSLVGGLSQ